ncbi:MAG: nucleotide sugar dehydrogenase, partial [Dehalococcoidales bacterium]|nr:nucleotide sugar dehydrogenase [Dehalococcoidales bacterium]
HQPLYKDLEEACHTVGRHLSPGKLVIIESTVAPGTTQNLIKPVLEQESGLKAGLPMGFGLCFSYERVMLGRLIHNLREYPKIVGGVDDLSTKRAMSIYKAIVKGGIYGTDPLTAEVAKTVENAYRDVQIAFANEVALLCESLGVDVHDVRRFVNGLPHDPSVPGANPIRNMHLPGAGVGGHCLPKDTWLLFYGFNRYADFKPAYPSSVLKDARILNEWMPVHMADLLEDGLKEAGKSIKDARIGILGYAFLENTDDSRNTPAVPLIRELEKRGAKFSIHDPFVSQDESYPIEHDLDRALLDCDALAVVTGHDLYKALDINKLKKLLKTRVIVDGRNVFDAGKLVEEGFIFRGVGKGNLRKRIVG